MVLSLLLFASVINEPLPALPSETILKITAYQDCVVAKAKELEPAKESVEETVKIATLACKSLKRLAAGEIVQIYRASSGSNYEAIVRLGMKFQQIDDEAQGMAKFAVAKERARVNSYAPNQ